MRVDAVRPPLAHRATIGVAEVEPKDAAGVGIEAGGEDQDVEVELGDRRPHASRGDAFDRCRFEVDEMDVRPVEGLVVPVLE